MSGIAGIRADARPEPALLRDALRRLHHRGGAHEEIHAQGAVVLGVTQSAREAANRVQPLRSADGRFTLVADGYCADARAPDPAAIGDRSDAGANGWTQVLAALAHGTGRPPGLNPGPIPDQIPDQIPEQTPGQIPDGMPEWLSRLDGAFAFALHDRDTGRLLLGRDRAGARPLYLARTMYGWAFASEPKALLALAGPPAVDPAALAAWLQGGFVAGRNTLMAGIERVQPGEVVVLDPGAEPVRLPPPAPHLAEPRPRARDGAERLDRALCEAIADPALLVGSDSTLILTRDPGSVILLDALVRAGRPPARTVSLGHAEDAGGGGAAASLARRYGIPHEVVPVGRDDVIDRLALAAWASDDPGGETDAPALLALGAALGADTGPVVTDAGAAEAFAAAPRFRVRRMSRWIDALLEPGTAGFRTRAGFRGLERSLFRPVLQRAAAEWREPVIDVWKDLPSDWTEVQRMQRLDLVSWLPATVLPGIDRSLAATGHDWCAPWLAPRVVALGLALPDAIKRGGRRSEGFLEWYARDRVLQGTPWTAPRPATPGPWLSGATLARVGRVLSASPAIRAWLAPDAIATLVRMRRDGRPAARRLLALLRFALWHRVFVEGDGERPAVGDPLAFLEGNLDGDDDQGMG